MVVVYVLSLRSRWTMHLLLGALVCSRHWTNLKNVRQDGKFQKKSAALRQHCGMKF